MKHAFSLVCTVVVLLYSSLVLSSSGDKVWLEVLVDNDTEGLHFTLPPTLVAIKNGRIELTHKNNVSTYYSFSSGYYLGLASDLVVSRGDGGWLFDVDFTVLKAQPLVGEVVSNCLAADITVKQGELAVGSVKSACKIQGSDWRISARYWALDGVRLESKEKSGSPSWWDVKPADERAKKRLKKK